MVEKTIAWLHGKVAEASPPETLEQGEIGVNIAALAAMLGALRAGGGTLFGMYVPGDVFALAGPELRVVVEIALASWKQRLERDFGEAGAETFRQIALRHGITLEPLPALRRDPAVSSALARLFAALDAAGAAYYVQRASDPVGFAQLADIVEVPAQLEALYAELDQLAIARGETGGRKNASFTDYNQIDPVARAEIFDIEQEAHVVIQTEEMGRILLVRVRDGAVLRWRTKFEDEPQLLAASIAEYLDTITAKLR